MAVHGLCLWTTSSHKATKAKTNSSRPLCPNGSYSRYGLPVIALLGTGVTYQALHTLYGHSAIEELETKTESYSEIKRVQALIWDN